MSKVLIINASARKERSLSRQLTNVFAKSWNEKYPNDLFLHREVGQENIPHVTERWIAGAFKPAHLRNEEDHEVLRLSNELISELKDSDIIVVGTPMYNWSVPSTLKAYIDQVLRVNETVLVRKDNPEQPYLGLLNGKKVYLLLVRGNTGYGPGEIREHMDFQTNYLKTVFSIMGVEDIECITLNDIDHLQKETLDQVNDQIRQLINCQDNVLSVLP
ncbi:FMN-dependent NADH-azoreductase [Chryseobacterium paridis]|uniref:FMN dependent NADH:quinone oxidoreductase n=1 Tax=Chryseobacterium paridis TaxID=2800328 RepID=A0ABS1FVF3_9FLAO|nr:NAD(P)H-dependent oxidoreductase [Chryseobacterium paridis]MBK1896238.1 NAD(P)H-dependent oxidoreductase [Chryseobacterium paridis]